MAYKDGFSERIDIDVPDEATRLIMEVIMKEGELRFRDRLTKVLADELIEVQKSTVIDEDSRFSDGISYVMQLLKEVDFND